MKITNRTAGRVLMTLLVGPIVYFILIHGWVVGNETLVFVSTIIIIAFGVCLFLALLVLATNLLDDKIVFEIKARSKKHKRDEIIKKIQKAKDDPEIDALLEEMKPWL